MTKQAALVVALLSSSLGACTTGMSYRLGGSGGGYFPSGSPAMVSEPSEPSAPSDPSGGPSYGPGEDMHWLTAEDFLVETGKDHGDFEAHVAKMTAFASNDSKGDARFLMFDGKETWASRYYQTRVATNADFAVGALAFCHYPSTYLSTPGVRSKQDARTSTWVAARITDTSALYKGVVSIGEYACPVRAARVPSQ